MSLASWMKEAKRYISVGLDELKSMVQSLRGRGLNDAILPVYDVIMMRLDFTIVPFPFSLTHYLHFSYIYSHRLAIKKKGQRLAYYRRREQAASDNDG